MSNSTPTAVAPADASGLSPAAHTFARFVTCVVVLAVPAMIGLICVRSYRVREPSTAVVIVGDRSINDAEVIVTDDPDPLLPAKKRREWHVTLNAANNWQTPIMLTPGKFHISVMHNKHEILHEPVELTQQKAFRFDPMARVAVIGPRGPGDINVQFTRLQDSGQVVEAQLLEANRYRTTVYMYPGNYRVVARTSAGVGGIVAEETFVVDRSGTCVLDLNKPINPLDPVDPEGS